MLLELRVANFALIEDLSFNFNSGLNVLSGETGAGKSIVIGAISLLLGERAAVEQIRQGKENAHVEGVFLLEGTRKEKINPLLEQAGIEMADELILAREVYSTGRSVARVNGRAVPVSFLKDLGRHLVDLHGQHQHQSLLRSEEHLDLLDSFGGDKIMNSRGCLEELFQKRQDLKNNLSLLGSDSTERERKLELYTYQLNEINQAALSEGEDEALDEKEKILANAEKLLNLVMQAYSIIYAGGDELQSEVLLDKVNNAKSLVDQASGIDTNLSGMQELLESSSAQLEEVAYGLRDYQAKFEYDPSELSLIQERQMTIKELKRKYGSTIEEVLNYADRTKEEMERLKNSEATALSLEKEIQELERQMYEVSADLNQLRRETAQQIEKELESILNELALPAARFEVQFANREELTPRGLDRVEFMFSANAGENVKPLTKIISGGEVSRVMLALKTILARQDLVPTLIFDEADAGIGGATVQTVAEKLAQLSMFHQVLCVTHSPQIAAMADAHYNLYKETVDDRTITRASLLDSDQRREELARMLDGAGIDQVSLKHVDRVMARARRFKNQEAG